MILMIFEVIFIMIVAVRCKVPQNSILVFWLDSYHVYRSPARFLHMWQPSLFKRYFLDQNIVITNEYDFDDNWRIQWMKKLFSCNYYLIMKKKNLKKKFENKKRFSYQ